MKVRQLLGTKGREVVTTEAENTVEDAIRSMHLRKISALVVADHGRPVGIFTERDVLRCYVATDGKNFKDIRLRDGGIHGVQQAQVVHCPFRCHPLRLATQRTQKQACQQE